MSERNKDEAYASLKAQVLDRVDNWEDLYSYFDSQMSAIRESMHPLVVFDALLSMYAFMESMRALPEEGDIKVLVERMLQTLVYHSKERMGMEVTVLRPGNTPEEQYEALKRAIIEAAEMSEAADDASTGQPAPEKRTLH